MKAISYKNTSVFLAAAGGLLQSDEVRYGLIYGIARLTAANPHHYGEEDPWFCTVGDDAGICTLAWRTPPHQVGLAWHAGDPEGTVSPLIDAVRSHWPVIPGVVGDPEITDLFAERWCSTCGVSIQSKMAQRIYRLDSVNEVPVVPGNLRTATLADKDLITEWYYAVYIDVWGESHQNQPARDVTPRIENGDIYLWEDDGKPISMAGKGRPTEHGMSVGPVYTPLEHRRKGYATACVAGVCREILKSGYNFCMLYTDLSNPTSNAIYMKIGFRPVRDSAEYTFSTPVL